MIIEKILQGLKISEQRVTTEINDTCLGFQIAEKEFIEKLLKNVADEIDRFNSSNDDIGVIGRSFITVGVRFDDWLEWERYCSYIYSPSSDKRIASFIKKSVLKYGFPENKILNCNDNGSFRVRLYSFKDWLGEDISNYDVE